MDTHLYTGKERDAESGLDFFGARFYGSTIGRWMSPDWAEKAEPIPYSSLSDPQSLNLYSYVYNNPLSKADADGHWPGWVSGVWDGVKSGARELGAGVVTTVQAANGDPAARAAIVMGMANTARDGWNMAAHPLQTAAGVKAGWASMSGREKAALITDTAVKALPAVVASAAGGGAAAESGAVATEPAVEAGSFSISDWSGYPAGIPQPSGPFRLLAGEEYDAARSAADISNQAMRQADPAAYAGQQIHHIQPVKFGGSPTDPANTIPLTPSAHQPVTNWWNSVMRSVK